MMNTPVTPEMLQEKDREINELNDTITEQKCKLKRNHRVYEDGRIKSGGDLIHNIRDLKRPIAMRYVFSRDSKDTPMSLDLGECFKYYLEDVCEEMHRFVSRYIKGNLYVWVGPHEFEVDHIENNYDGLSQQELAEELAKKDAVISDKKGSIGILKSLLDEVDKWEHFRYLVGRADSELLPMYDKVENASSKTLDLELSEWYRNAFFTVVDYLYTALELEDACEEFRQ